MRSVYILCFCLFILINTSLTCSANRSVSPGQIQVNKITVIESEHEVYDMAWQPGGFLLAEAEYYSENSGIITVWNTKTQKIVHLLEYGTTLEGPQLAWNPDGRKLAVVHLDPIDGHSDNIYVWEITETTATLLSSMRHAADYSSSITIAWGEDSQQILSFRHDEDRDEVKIWDAVSGVNLNTFDDLHNTLSANWLSSEKELVLGKKDGSAEISHIPDFELLTVLPPNNQRAFVNWIDWTPDKNYLVGIGYNGADSAIWVWDVNNQSVSEPISADRLQWVIDQEIHPTKNVLATISKNSSILKVWEISSEVELLSFLDLPANATSLSWSTDNDQIAISLANGQILIWEIIVTV